MNEKYLRHQMTNIIDNGPVRLALFTLILDNDHSEDEILKNPKIAEEYYFKMGDVNEKYPVLDLFPTSSSHICISGYDEFTPIGNKQTFQHLTSKAKSIIEMQTFDWAMRYLLDEKGVFDIRKELRLAPYNILNYLGEYAEDFNSYIKEYYIEKTSKKQFSKKDLNIISGGLFSIYMDICAFLLSVDQIDAELTFDVNPMIRQAREDLLAKKKDMPFDTILTFTSLNRMISLNDSNIESLPVLYREFLKAIQLLHKKFKGNLQQIEHIIKIGFERFLVFMSDYTNMPPGFHYLMDDFDSTLSGQYNILVGIKLIDKVSIDESLSSHPDDGFMA